MSTVRTIGRYDLYAELASGGMATVHFARQRGALGFARTVAVKRLHANYAKDPEFVAMLVDEARLAARIQHPNVVTTLDVVAEDGEVSVVLEYVHGEPLHRLTRALPPNERMPLPFVSAIISGILHGLHAAHEARDERGEPLGIVHRDVSPQNVLVGVDGVPRVLDFGIAKASGRIQTTKDGQIKGKLAYMAPEQCRSEPVDHRTDIYATGVMLWELLAGRRLFKGDNDASVLEQVLLGIVKPPSRWVPALPAALDDIAMQALERDPKARFASAHEMAIALERVVQPAPTRELGEWVKKLAGEVLSERAEQIAQIESKGLVPTQAPSVSERDTPRQDDLTVVDPPREPPRRRAALFVVSAVIALAALLLVAAAFRTPRASTTSPIASTSEAPLPATSPPPPPPPLVSAVPSPAPAPKPTFKPVAKPVAPKKPDCNPPYYFDAQFKKHYKADCI